VVIVADPHDMQCNAPAPAVAPAPLTHPSLRAGRASQDERGEELPLSERSEFGQRPRSSEKRREPARSGGLRSTTPFSGQATAVLLTFDKTKVSRAAARKPLHWNLIPVSAVAVTPKQQLQQVQRREQKPELSLSRCAGGASHFSLLVQRKVTKRKHRPDASRRGCATSVRCASRPDGHAAQTRFAQTRAALRPVWPAMLGSLYGRAGQQLSIDGNSNSNSNSNSNGRWDVTAGRGRT